MKISLSTGLSKGQTVIVKIDNDEWYAGQLTRVSKDKKVTFLANDGEEYKIDGQDMAYVKPISTKGGKQKYSDAEAQKLAKSISDQVILQMDNKLEEIRRLLRIDPEESGELCGMVTCYLWEQLGKPRDLIPCILDANSEFEGHMLLGNKSFTEFYDPTADQFGLPTGYTVRYSKDQDFYKKNQILSCSKMPAFDIKEQMSELRRYTQFNEIKLPK